MMQIILTTDQQLAEDICKKHGESAILTVHCSENGKFYYTVTYPTGVGNIQPNVDDNLFI